MFLFFMKGIETVPNIIENILLVLLAVPISNILHEFIHFLFCLFLRCKVLEVKIPFLKISWDNNFHCSFSLRENNRCTFSTSNKVKAILIAIVGPLLNLIAGITMILVWYCHFLNAWGVAIAGVYNVALFIHNMLPRSGGDGALIVRHLREK